MTDAPRSLTGRWLVLAGILVLAFNLRPAAVSVGPVLADVRDGLGMNAVETGMLTSLPVLAFATVGAVAPRLARLLGVHKLTLVALLAVVLGLFARAQVSSIPLFLALSLLALAGMATANVLLPSLVKLHFPDRVGLMTALYSTGLAVGLTAASVLTVPFSEAFGGWRSGLVAWAVTAAVAAVPWVVLVREDRRSRAEDLEAARAIGLGDVARTRLGWLMAVFFGLQSMQAYAIFGWFAVVYRDAGFSAHTSGLLLGAITGISIPFSFILPSLAARRENQAGLMWAVMLCYPIGYLGLIFSPQTGALVWALFVGLGTCTFPLILTLIGLRARTPVGTAALSGFTQSVGYLIAIIGPFGVGVLHDLSGGWTVPLLVMTAINVPQLLVGLALSRPAYVEDELGTSPEARSPAGT